MTGSQRDWNWSPVEKRIARQAFDRALHLEKESAIREFKERVDRIHTIEDIDELWELEGWLRQRRRSIDDRFDYRYSVLDSVLADFLARGQIAESDLDGLGPEKLERIREVAQFFRQGERGPIEQSSSPSVPRAARRRCRETRNSHARHATMKRDRDDLRILFVRP